MGGGTIEERGGRKREGRGNSFCEQRQFWLSWFLSPARLCVGKGAFPEPEKADSQNLAMEAPRDSVGLAGEGTEFSLMTWAFVFQISSPDFIHESPGLLGSCLEIGALN